ncbi:MULTISPECIES: MerR family transcriptional regulator [unclassified Duganella]|uniref:MerR family transcriptional regulator n=1 Tax=unclassified Duganella TaxID=2636909 RepID=UPI000E34B349|nr:MULTISPECIES: MerR family transcriptional regulator [unclassified Duganella]RFP14886.1 MerR family transcriptional regulator [Duganella sp. BJB475]RFP31236.1 MerR family transcriptional regulator [Duganella sp. BJB476]
MEKTVLKIGELAARSGLTVRALHHYDSIGLLTPSARAASGYRLYNRDDVARLHHIQALRRFGMSLADIATFLASPDAPFADIVAQQIAALGKQIEQATTLRLQLTQLQDTLSSGRSPELSDWLATLEEMDLYDKYFTREELKRLPFWQQHARRNTAWAALVDEAETLIEQGAPPDDARAGELSQRWMRMLEHDTAANPEFARRLTVMLDREAKAQQQTRITPALKEYVSAAFGARKLAIYARYLNADEMRTMRENSGKNQDQWMSLIAGVHQHLEDGVAHDAPSAQALARQWMTLYLSQIGGDPATLAKIRAAHDQEPALLSGTWIPPAMLDYIRTAYATLA